MKIKGLFFLLAVSLCTTSVYTQAHVGLKFGLSSFDMAKNTLVLMDQSVDKYEISFEDAKYGFHFGFYGDFQLSKFSIHPAIVFNTNRVNYKIKDVTAESIVKSYKNYNSLDVPVIFGLNFSRLRIQAGPVAHINLSSTMDVLETDQYEEKFKTATYGYQAGIALRLMANLRLELNYEGNFGQFGEQFIYKGNNYQFEDRPQRIVASVMLNII